MVKYVQPQPSKGMVSKIVMVSSVDGLTVRPSGPWIYRKHFYLKRYADIFTRGMQRKWVLTYIDLFAGPGRCLIESTGTETDGSPLIALNYDFSSYVFVESHPRDLDALKERCSNSPKSAQIKFILGDCNTVIDQIHPRELSLAFIDPTGIDIRFDTLRTLTKNRRVDLLINIQFGMDIKRNFGRYLKMKTKSELDLFLGGNVSWDDLKTPRDAIRIYKNQIKELGYSTVEYKDMVVRNVKNAPMYFLLFASKNPRGLYFWKEITAKDEMGQYEMF